MLRIRHMDEVKKIQMQTYFSKFIPKYYTKCSHSPTTDGMGKKIYHEEGNNAKLQNYAQETYIKQMKQKMPITPMPPANESKQWYRIKGNLIKKARMCRDGCWVESHERTVEFHNLNQRNMMAKSGFTNLKHMRKHPVKERRHRK